MNTHIMAATLSILCSVAGIANYIYNSCKGKTKPHLFSWLVWFILMSITAMLAYLNGAIASTFVIANGCLMCFIIFLLSFRYGEKNITRSDWGMLVAALIIIPIWAVTQQPLVAAILSSLIFAFGYGPTFRKAWTKPQEENLSSFGLWSLQSCLSVLAVDPYTLVTGLYPTSIFIMDMLLVTTLLVRRQTLSRTQISRYRFVRHNKRRGPRSRPVCVFSSERSPP